MSVSYLSAVGIDLGTTYSSIGRLDPRGNVFLFNDKVTQQSTIPSVVSYANRTPKVGAAAYDDQRKNPQDVIYDAKRMLGHNYHDDIIQKFKDKWLFKVKQGQNDEVLIETSHGVKRPIDVCCDIIKYLLQIGYEYSEGREITHAVISIPANYNSTQRDETKKAAEMAGLRVVHLISEPTAGITAYWFSDGGHYQSHCGKKNILTYDFGGGTLDISLAQVDDDKIDIIAVNGDMSCGGRDIDNNLVDYYLNQKGASDLLDDLKKESRIGIRARNYYRRITDECQKAKVAFSNSNDDYNLSPDIDLDIYDCYDPELHISKSTFDRINKNIIDKLIKPIQQIFKDARDKNLYINEKNLTHVILIGGSCYNKFVYDTLLRYFKKMPIKNTDPRDAVVKGASIDAGRRYVQNVCPDLTVREVCPLSIGVALAGKRMLTVIPRNSNIPISNVESLTTLNNYCTGLTFNIHETERPIATDDTHVGSFDLEIPSRMAGDVDIKLKLSLDQDGILNGSAWVEGEESKYNINLFRIKKYSAD